MIAKLKNCDGCNKLKPIWKNFGGKRFCKACWSCHQDNTSARKPIAKQSKIPPKSSKKEKLDRLYSVQRKIFLGNNPMCVAALPGCTQASSDVHHMEGRTGDRYLDTTTWLAVCRHCHRWIEDHPLEAKELGFSRNRL